MNDPKKDRPVVDELDFESGDSVTRPMSAHELKAHNAKGKKYLRDKARTALDKAHPGFVKDAAYVVARKAAQAGIDGSDGCNPPIPFDVITYAVYGGEREETKSRCTLVQFTPPASVEHNDKDGTIIARWKLGRPAKIKAPADAIFEHSLDVI